MQTSERGRLSYDYLLGSLVWSYRQPLFVLTNPEVLFFSRSHIHGVIVEGAASSLVG